ncbi:thiamine-phosphate kinase [Oryzomonas japonica]|uniref:Thiamine-monophosphate kinase n=1 Tax=Oryzomonas japonica TaxID=2603858 RepID=A0A7J4ZS73_9BACT|nr:thiamine-phosphate kinase [Oryzomonas japonica]KAB0666117.1 thiamine-phosphate kinase [Oryzomonas japonica]
MKIGELGEFGLISRIASGVANGKGVITGIGDDAAVTALSPGMQLLTSTDMLVEDVHFRRVWHDPCRLGRKSLAVSISDIAAMGGIPRWALLSLAVPPDTPLEFLDAFTRGFLAMAAEHGVALIGGDTCSSRAGLVISVTIMGEQEPGRIVRRSGACPDDDIWVTGTLGDAALGLELLEKGKLPSSVTVEEEHLISRLLDPSPRAAVGRALAEAGLVSAMIDVSDGLLADFGHIAELSALGGTIHLDALPLSPDFRAILRSHPSSHPDLALAGGEEYELAFTAPAANREKIVQLMKKSGIDARPVGIVTASPEVTVVLADGSTYAPQNKGYNHFT